MNAVIQSLLAGLPVLILHSATTFAILAAGVGVYLWVTPYKEIALIKAGNTAAAITLSGAIVGMAIPLAVSLAGSVNVWDILIWGAVTLVLMLVGYRVVDLMIRDIARRIEADEIGPAILLLAVKLAIGTITAAAVSG